jgi:IclR helix-turn-helix domain
VSELLDRILKEIRERLEASRAAVHEHERLEAALRALGGAGARATHVVSGDSTRQRPAAGATRPAAKQPTAAKGKRPAAAPRAGVPTASAPAARRSRAASAKRRGGSAARAGRTTPARKRAPRGANRAAVLRVVGERPGVSAPEIAAVSGVSGGTLYSLLRTLSQRGELEKRDLPSGQTGYTLATTPTSDAATPTPAPTTGEPTPTATPTPARGDQPDDTTASPVAGSTRQADASTPPGQTATNEPES